MLRTIALLLLVVGTSAQTSSATSCYATIGDGDGGYLPYPLVTDMRALSPSTDFYTCFRVCQKCVAENYGCSDADISNSAWVPLYLAFTTSDWTRGYEVYYNGPGFKNLFDCGENNCNTVEPNICDDDYAAPTSNSGASSSLKVYASFLAALGISLMFAY